jgi:hypothetical protein
MVHGGIAMIALLVLGALAPLHLQRSWRAGRNRLSGSAVVAANAMLIVTAFALYYAGSDAVRVVAADIHIAAGLGLPVLIVTHIVLGRRTHAFARQAGQVRAGPLTPRPLLRPVTFSEDRESP